MVMRGSFLPRYRDISPGKPPLPTQAALVRNCRIVVPAAEMLHQLVIAEGSQLAIGEPARLTRIPCWRVRAHLRSRAGAPCHECRTSSIHRSQKDSLSGAKK